MEIQNNYLMLGLTIFTKNKNIHMDKSLKGHSNLKYTSTKLHLQHDINFIK